MKKFIVVLFFLVNMLFGYDGIERLYTFVGVQNGYSKYDNIDASTIGISYGKQNKDWRTSINYNYAYNNDHTYHSLILQVDRGILIDLFQDSLAKPYIGIAFGAMEHRKGGFHDRGYLFGGAVGFNYVFNREIDIDLGYRLMSASKLKKFDTRGDLMLSLHYYFD
jgi:hypothetical protein